jgi:hypothetical protein
MQRTPQGYQGPQLMPKFEPGNRLGGRPRGARNRLANRVFEDMLEFWNEPAKDGSAVTKGKAAMLTMWRERPHEFVKFVGSVMPKEFLFENVVTELADEELDRMIEMLRERALAARQEHALDEAAQLKLSPPDAPHR